VNRATRVRARFVRAIASLAAGLAIATPASASLFSNVYVFGDSLLDTGNVYTATGGTTPPSPPYFNGRWSNGPLAVDIFAAAYGVNPLLPSLLGGTNFAWGGARAVSTPDSSVPDVPDQVGQFIFALGGSQADPNAVYVLDGGGNDIIPALQSATPDLVLQAALKGIQDSIAALLNAGARNILLYNVPDVGATPVLQGFGAAAQAGATFLTMQFNQGLAAIEMGFDAMGSGVNVSIVDLFALNAAAIANPGAYGFTNVTDPCLQSNGSVCSNPNGYFYWDGFHPTAATGQLLAGAMFAAVPEPGSLVLVALALFAFAFARRRLR
jgi:outer membrane lipase/esterase